MSATTLSSDSQIRYLMQWFEEWSELQRADFLPILAEKVAKGSYVNGVIHSMANVNCDEKPMNLFQCRVKLFNDWYPSWSEEDQKRLVKHITDLDEQFASNLEAEINGTRIVDTGLPDYIQEFVDQNADNEAKEVAAVITNTEQPQPSKEEALESEIAAQNDAEDLKEQPNVEEIENTQLESNVTCIEIAATS